LGFLKGDLSPEPPKTPVFPPEDCVALLSGGLDSFVGNIDLAASGKRAFVVSQIVRGDAEKQRDFAGLIGGGLRHMQVNHNAEVPEPETPPSQRARSLIFLAYGVLAATTLKKYHAGKTVTLYVCENGFISVNPPLTDLRLGSLSTSTTHPVFLRQIQQLLDIAGLHIHIENPYQLKTKGEMLVECLDKKLLRAQAWHTTSCGRFLQHGYTHCGRCMPCLVRRAAFRAAGMKDDTEYVFKDLGNDDDDYASFDDVRSVAIALADVKSEGLENWLGASLSTTLLGDVVPLQAMVGRGLRELGSPIKSLRCQVIDFHCHLDLYLDRSAVRDECARRGVYVMSVTTTPSAWRGTSALAGNAARIRTALGLHPQLAHERRSELGLFDALLPKARYVGEIGLDGAPSFASTGNIR
jgi:7-cyano-7-deazaguanine synthase in queuosine biosynthesis